MSDTLPVYNPAAEQKVLSEIDRAFLSISEKLASGRVLDAITGNLLHTADQLQAILQSRGYKYENVIPVVSGYSSPVEELFVELLGGIMNEDILERTIRIPGNITPSTYDVPKGQMKLNNEIRQNFQNPSDVLVFVEGVMTTGRKAFNTMSVFGDEWKNNNINFQDAYFVAITTAGQRAFRDPTRSMVSKEQLAQYDEHVLRADGTNSIDYAQSWMNITDTRTEAQKEAYKLVSDLSFLISNNRRYAEKRTIRFGIGEIQLTTENTNLTDSDQLLKQLRIILIDRLTDKKLL